MAIKLEDRVAALEREVARLRTERQASNQSGREWLDDWCGLFKNDPIFEQVVKLGRAYRRSTIPRRRKNKSH
jgi:hypothetical protein